MGLVGFQIAQSGRAGTLGWCGTVLTGIGIMFVTNSAVLSLANRHALDDTDAYHSSIAGGYEFYGIVAISLGLILLTVATFRAGLHPRWVAWLLVANLVLTVLSQRARPGPGPDCRSHRLTGDFVTSTAKFRWRSAGVTG